ncbi:MAG: nitroreductase family protein [Marinilabiliales bacterium]
MDTLKAIFERRSIRKYKSTPVEEEKINMLLKAGMYAPSARNQQPWHFIVIDDRKILNDLATIHPYAKMLLEAPLAILVCSDDTLEETKGYQAVDCSAATQNILLAAHDLGLGSVWLGVYPREQRMNDIKNLFALPKHIHPISLIAIGYPDETKEVPDRFHPERIHINKW